MRLCDLCHGEIRKWHSYEVNGYSCVHMSCALGQTPAAHPGDRWHGDPNLMLPKHKAQTEDGRLTNIPPHLRRKSDD